MPAGKRRDTLIGTATNSTTNSTQLTPGTLHFFGFEGVTVLALAGFGSGFCFLEGGRRMTGIPMSITLSQLKRTVLYSEELGIDLAGKTDRQYFRWFLASMLFGGHISETIARHTYRAFEQHELMTPKKILSAGWDYLVFPVMREGGYVRYDGRKSDQILRDCRMLLDEYDGSLIRLHGMASDKHDLESRLLAFYGVGPVTANIFLRELRPHWRKADPEPLPAVTEKAVEMGLDLDAFNRKTITFTRIEAGLIRSRKEK